MRNNNRTIFVIPAMLVLLLLLFSSFPSLSSSPSVTAMAQQTTEAGTATTGTTTISTDQSATTDGSTSQLTFALRMEDQVEGAGGGGTASTTSSSATNSDLLPTRNIGIDVNIVRGGNEPPISLPINVTIPANVNNLELCASAMTVGAVEMCQPVLRTIDLTQNGAAAATNDTTASGTSSSSASSSSAPTMTAPTTSFPPATTGNSLIDVEDTTVNIPITVIAPITAQIQNARLCAQLPSGTQSCNQIILNPQQTAYTPVNVDMTTSPAPTVTSSQVTDTTTATGTPTTGTADTGGGTTSSSSSTTTTTTTPTTPTTPPTTTPGNNNNNTTDTTGGGTTSFPSMPSTPSRDTTPPVLSGPDNTYPYIVETASATAKLPYYVTAADNVDGTARLDENNMLIQGDNFAGSITISCNPPSNTNLPLGNHTVQCSATDAAGNLGTTSFIISVISTTGTLPGGSSSSGGITASLSANPPIYEGPICPADIDSGTKIEFSGTITDNVGNRDVTYRFKFSDGGSTAQQVIHFNQPGSQTVSTDWTLFLPSFQGWVAIEILQPVQLQSNRAEFEIRCAAPSTGGAPPPGGTDTIAPSLSVPVTRVIPTTSPTGQERVLYDVSATDNVDGTARLDENNVLRQEDNFAGDVAISCNPPSNTNFRLGNHTVQCRAIDAAGNRGTASFIVAVTNTTANTPPGGTSSGGVGGITISDLHIDFLSASGPVASDTNTYNGSCPVGASISGTITDNVGNRDVTYRLIMNDGVLPEGVRHFDQPGSEIVSFGIQTLGGFNNVQSYQGWFTIEILQPVQLQSQRVEFDVICTTPSTGGAALAAQTLQAENDTTATIDEEDAATTDEEDTTAATTDEEDTTAATTDEGEGETPPPPPPPPATTDEEGEEGVEGGGEGETPPPPPATTDEGGG
jgi:hypothetical protein